MLRRSVVEISSRKYYARIPRQITHEQMPPILSFRREFSDASQTNASQSPDSTSKSSNSGSFLTKFIIGSVVVGGAILTAYQTGYLDQIIVKEQHGSLKPASIAVDDRDTKNAQNLGEKVALPDGKELYKSSSNMEQKTEPNSDVHHVEDFKEKDGKGQFSVKDRTELTPEESTKTSMKSNDQMTDSGVSSEGSIDVESPEAKTSTDQNDGAQLTSISIQESTVPEKSNMDTVDMTKETLGKDVEPPNLVDAYHLGDNGDRSTATSSNGKGTGGDKNFSKEREALASMIEDLNDAYISKNGKLVLDFLEAIHAAEQRQAELDTKVFSEQKRVMKEKYEKELKDARVRELMFAEEAAIMEKELNKERAKLAATIKSLQEKAEENLKMELEKKEKESELELKKVQELAKAELAAAIASEKASLIEKIAEANLHIDALCMAFYARSEEARQSHSVHKLALGALALQDALSKGLPIEREIEALHKYLQGIDKDSLLGLVLSSLPEETQKRGTDTLLQLNEKFDSLKGTLRHFILIPPGGGGLLAHSLAHIASWLKIAEADQSGDGIEALIKRVDSCLVNGQLAEAADTLEEGVKGSQAEEIVIDWVKQARNRALAEQALTLIHSYASSLST